MGACARENLFSLSIQLFRFLVSLGSKLPEISVYRVVRQSRIFTHFFLMTTARKRSLVELIECLVIRNGNPIEVHKILFFD